jgi:hypothetical protein
MDNRRKLLKWIKSQGYSELESGELTNDLYRKLSPYSIKLSLDIDKFFISIMQDTACTSLAKFKEIANFRIKRKIKNL